MTMKKNSGQKPNPGKPHPRLSRHLGDWLKREDAGVTGGTSSLFWSHHGAPRAPERTCLYGHEMAPGASSCTHGHPAG